MRDPLRYVVWCGAGHEGVRVPRVRDDARTIACGTLAVLCRTSSALVARGPVVDGGAALVAKPLEDGLVLVVRIATNRLDPRRWRRPPLAPEALGSARRAGRCDREQRRRGARRHRREPTTNSCAPAKRTRFFPLPLAGAVRSADFMASRRAHACRSDLHPACRGRLGPLRFAARHCVASRRRECYTCEARSLTAEGMTTAATALS